MLCTVGRSYFLPLTACHKGKGISHDETFLTAAFQTAQKTSWNRQIKISFSLKALNYEQCMIRKERKIWLLFRQAEQEKIKHFQAIWSLAIEMFFQCTETPEND